MTETIARGALLRRAAIGGAAAITGALERLMPVGTPLTIA